MDKTMRVLLGGMTLGLWLVDGITIVHAIYT